MIDFSKVCLHWDEYTPDNGQTKFLRLVLYYFNDFAGQILAYDFFPNIYTKGILGQAVIRKSNEGPYTLLTSTFAQSEVEMLFFYICLYMPRDHGLVISPTNPMLEKTLCAFNAIRQQDNVTVSALETRQVNLTKWISIRNGQLIDYRLLNLVYKFRSDSAFQALLSRLVKNGKFLPNKHISNKPAFNQRLLYGVSNARYYDV